MATEILYDNTGQPIADTDPAVSGTGGAGFSFTSDATQAGTLADVKVELTAGTPTDGGSVSVGLYSSANGAPGALIANIGTILDSQLTTTPTLIDVPVTSTIILDPNTQYYIETNGSPGSSVSYAYESADAGTGVSGQSYEDGGTPSDNSQGAYIAQVSETVCFASGTLVRTVRGDVAVERLAVGDLAVTASGAHRPISWLGSRTVDCRRHPRPAETMPVRISARAFGENRPARDLLVSPGHSLCVDVVGEVLIPAGALINGATITQEDVDHVTYWHVELEGGHDILLAENMPAESYLEMGNRGFFAESGVVELDASPDAPVVTHADFCRPFQAEGALVEAVRAQLAVRATRLGWRLEPDALGGMYLMVDGQRVEPRVRGLSARFSVPGGARDVWLVSCTGVPAEIAASSDHRALGLYVDSLAVDDGYGLPRHVAGSDSRLCVGFHAAEGEGACMARWTAGRARLPAELWDGVADDFFLRVDLAGPALPRWVAPAAAAVAQPDVKGSPSLVA